MCRQVAIYKQRFNHTFDAVGHLLNTGRGVVVVRPAHGDYVYYEVPYLEFVKIDYKPIS